MDPDSPDNKSALAGEIKAQARRLGFDLAGIAPATPSHYRDYLRQWLDDGRHGTMDWLANRFEERTDPTVYLPGAASVICVGLNYFTQLAGPPDDADHGRIARYALGEDYHEIIKSRLHLLADWIRSRAPDAQTRTAVDTAPVMEKELAARAGVGWLGKNTCIINQGIGSWILLGEIITTLLLPPDEPAVDRCGSCTRCIDACPTGAFSAPYQLDARKCISYLTIEHRGQIPAQIQSGIADWLYGCDICQEVCPWNHRAPISTDPAFSPRFADGSLGLSDVLGWSPQIYQETLRGSAMKRVKLPQLQRNAQIALRNLSASSPPDIPVQPPP
jgi:epoxyqueuosine reductase